MGACCQKGQARIWGLGPSALHLDLSQKVQELEIYTLTSLSKLRKHGVWGASGFVNTRMCWEDGSP